MSGLSASGVLKSVGDVMNETDLLERLRNGSHEAFEELVRRHINWVHSVARRRVRDAHLTEDVTQASFTTLYQKPPRLKAGQTLSLWLFTVVNHAALDTLRTEARRRRRETEAARMKGDLTTSEASQWAEFEPYLDELVGGLSDEDRQAVLMRYYEQKPFGEIGAALGVSDEAARKRVDRATDKLRAMLESKGVRMSVAVLGVVLTAQVTQAAPVVLAGTITAGAMVAKTTFAAKAMAAVTSGPGQISFISLIVAWLIIAAVLAQRDVEESQLTTNAVAHTAAAEYVPIPGWKARFDRVYLLEPGEVLKNIQAPYIPERGVHMNIVIRQGDARARMSVLWFGAGFQWDHASQQFIGRAAWVGPYSTPLFRILRMLGVPSYELQGSDEWLKPTMHGDWIFSKQATVPERLDALSAILREQYQRRIRFEKRVTEQHVVVARGRYQFKPLPGTRIRAQGDWLHLHAGTYDPNYSTVNYEPTGLPGLFNQASSNLRIRFIDETEKAVAPGELTLTWQRSAESLFNMSAGPERDRGVKSVIESIVEQTGLRLTWENRQFEVWHIVDEEVGK